MKLIVEIEKKHLSDELPATDDAIAAYGYLLSRHEQLISRALRADDFESATKPRSSRTAIIDGSTTASSNQRQSEETRFDEEVNEKTKCSEENSQYLEYAENDSVAERQKDARRTDSSVGTTSSKS